MVFQHVYSLNCVFDVEISKLFYILLYLHPETGLKNLKRNFQGKHYEKEN